MLSLAGASPWLVSRSSLIGRVPYRLDGASPGFRGARVEFRSLIAEAEGEDFTGHEGVRRWWVQVAQAMGGLGFEVEEYAEEGDGIVTKLRVRGNVGTTGIEQTMWQGVTIRDEKIAWWATFRSEEEAWAAVRERRGR